jgi:hypothetical protein
VPVVGSFWTPVVIVVSVVLVPVAKPTPLTTPASRKPPSARTSSVTHFDATHCVYA